LTLQILHLLIQEFSYRKSSLLATDGRGVLPRVKDTRVHVTTWTDAPKKSSFHGAHVSDQPSIVLDGNALSLVKYFYTRCTARWVEPEQIEMRRSTKRN
jgi:hypothetical protein